MLSSIILAIIPAQQQSPITDNNKALTATTAFHNNR